MIEYDYRVRVVGVNCVTGLSQEEIYYHVRGASDLPVHIAAMLHYRALVSHAATACRVQYDGDFLWPIHEVHLERRLR